MEHLTLGVYIVHQMVYNDHKLMEGGEQKVLKEIMRRKSLTAYRVGKLSGLPAGLISAYVNGEKHPGAKNIIKLCDALGCTADELLGRKNEQKGGA